MNVKKVGIVVHAEDNLTTNSRNHSDAHASEETVTIHSIFID